MGRVTLSISYSEKKKNLSLELLSIVHIKKSPVIYQKKKNQGGVYGKDCKLSIKIMIMSHYQAVALTDIPLGLTVVLCSCHSGETHLLTGHMLIHVLHFW